MGDDSTITGFGTVDAASRPEAFKGYLDAVSRVAAVQAYKRRSYDLLRLAPGHRILDLGCGTGEDVRAIGAIVGSNGLVVGIDNSEVMIAESRRRSEGLGLPIEFRVGDAARLPFEDGSFDGTRSERMFQHLLDPTDAFREMIRVTRRGGRIAVLDPDWETVTIDSADRPTTRRILTAGCDAHLSAWAGRHHFAMFREFGLAELDIVPVTVPVLDFALADQILELHHLVDIAVAAAVIQPDEGLRWLQDLEQKGRRGQFFSSVTGFGAGGTKP